MPAGTIAAPRNNAGPERNPGQAPAMPINPFVRAAREHREPFVDDSVLNVAATSFQRGPFDVAAFGYARHIVLLVTQTTSTGASTFTEDAPYSALDNITLTDVNGVPIVGPVNGFDLYLINKFGAYTFDTDPANYSTFSASTAAGTYGFKLRIPIEITGRDGLGALPNMSAASAYKVGWTISAPSQVYASGPTALGTTRVRAYLEAWTQPPETDARGARNEQAPPAMGTTQYWSRSFFPITAGANVIRLTRVGNLLRNVIFVFRNTTPARNSTNFPDPFRLEWDGRVIDNIAQALFNDQVRERYGFAAMTGVFPYDFTHDLDYHPGDEMRDGYWPTTQASRIEISGTFGVAGQLEVLTNDVAPAGPVTASEGV